MSIIDKLLARRKIDETTGCWLWTGNLNQYRYGQIEIDGKSYLIHRLSYQEFVGPIVNQVNHKLICPYRHCFNPEHLYDGTQSENCVDKYQLRKHHGRELTHCKYGHEFTSENTILREGYKRRCRICRKLQSQKDNNKKK